MEIELNCTTLVGQMSNQTQSTACQHQMEVLHQYSGQCWNDASIVLMWFASGLGPIVQNRMEEATLINDFEQWLMKETIQQQITALFPDVRTSYNAMVYYFKQYLQCMVRRYNLWKNLEGTLKIKTNVQRTESCDLSLCGERFGIMIAEIIFQDPQRLQAPLQALKNKSTIVSGSGYSVVKFNNVLYILLQFLLKGNISLLVYHKNDIQNYLSLLHLEKNPVLIHNPYDSIFQVEHYNFQSFEPILKHIDQNARVSIVVGLKYIGDSISHPRLHAITFMTCSDGGEYIYDDNQYILANMYWLTMFKYIPLSYDRICFIYISKHDGSPIFGIPIPEVSPLLMSFTTIGNGSVVFLLPGEKKPLYQSNLFNTNTEAKNILNDLELSKEELENGKSSRFLAEQLLAHKADTFILYYFYSFFYDPNLPPNQQASIDEFRIINTSQKDKNIMRNKLVNIYTPVNPYVSKQENTLETILKNEQDALDELFLKAIAMNNIAEVQRLLKKGANVHASNDLAMDIALKVKNPDIITLLIKNGMDKELLKNSTNQGIRQLYLSLIGGRRKSRKFKKRKAKTKRRKVKGKSRKH